jgi:ATP-dependent helicase/nuclease subunit A
MTPLEHDLAARALARREFTRPVWIEAGAGTGKTALLVARLCVWSLGTGWERARLELQGQATGGQAAAERVLEGLCALTFTEKAAAEMQQRFREALAELSAGGMPIGIEPGDLSGSREQQAERATQLLQALQDPIGMTLHAFAQQLIRSDPPAAGFPLAYQVDAEGLERRECMRAVVDSALRRALEEPPDAQWLKYLGSGGTPQRLVDCLDKLCEIGVGLEELQTPRYTHAVLRELLSALEAAFADAQPVLAPLARASARSKITQTIPERLASHVQGLRTLLEQDAGDLGTLSGAVAAWAEKLEASLVKRIGDYAKSKYNKSEAELLANTAEATEVALRLAQQLRYFQSLDAVGYERVRALLAKLLRELRARLQQEGIVSFQDLLQGALRVVRDRDLCRMHAARIRQLLVDEFQDTDPVQCELVERLALDPAHARRPGLFIVGDPKQSIYAWRSADLKAYEDFKGSVERAGGVQGVLARNFRSTPRILRAVESVFESAMRPEPGVQPPFQVLVAHKQAEGPPIRVRDTRVPGESNLAYTSRAREAQWIARDILEARAAGRAWKDHAILVRRGGQYEALIKGLREAEIPYEVRGDRSFYRRREILDAAAWLRAAVDPGDALALLAALRSSACGVPDAAWIPLQQAGFLTRMQALVGDPLADQPLIAGLHECIARAAPAVADLLEEAAGTLNWPLLLHAAVDDLGELRRLARTASTAEFFHALRSQTRLEWLEARRYLGEYRLANLQSFFDALQHRSAELDGDLGALLRELSRDLENEREQREAKPLREARDAVQLMTIHQAKGLDFPRVFLVGLESKGRAFRGVEPVRSTRLADGRRSLALDGLPDPLELAAGQRREAVEQAESVRTLYVAMTRPKEELILLGQYPEDGYREPAAQSSSHAGMLPCLQAGVRPEHPDWVLEEFSAQTAPAVAAPAVRTGTAGDFPPARARDRAAAQAREQLLFSRSPSLGLGEEPKASGPGGAGRELGIQVHTALEQWLLDASLTLEQALEHYAPLARAKLPGLGNPAMVDALHRARAHRIGAELELVASDLAEAPRALHLSGRMDLFYRDPADGALVVVDFKTDAAPAIEARLPHYCEQLRAYSELLRRAWPASTVRCELWFLEPGEIRKLAD